MDRTTKKLLGIEPHKGVTLAGILKSHPRRLGDLFEKAVAVIEGSLDTGDLDAAKFVCNHHLGTPKQKIEHSGEIKQVINPVDTSKLSDKEKNALREIIHKSKKE